ncbi:Uncharacterised protein [Salmonella enterica subsp. enterica]|uniref:Uncharacterized protein n=1 Tax=Salmonella enterica I TaxID=59201 RepID=A0A447TW72_SALET|nr:Uncharacterised protein [Salmonella enterica subsp. enterica]
MALRLSGLRSKASFGGRIRRYASPSGENSSYPVRLTSSNKVASPLRRSVRVTIAPARIRSSAYSDNRRRARVTAVYTSSRVTTGERWLGKNQRGVIKFQTPVIYVPSSPRLYHVSGRRLG